MRVIEDEVSKRPTTGRLGIVMKFTVGRPEKK